MSDDPHPPGISPLPWSKVQALHWQGRNSRKISWLGFYARGAGKGDLPVHSIKPQGIEDSSRRLADAHLLRAAPDLYAILGDTLPHLPDTLRSKVESIRAAARGEDGPQVVPLMGEVYDLV
jgi:hypothetical protein